MAIKMRLPVRVTGVTLDKSSITLTTVGATEQLTATISPNNAEDTAVTWSSSDTTVATVSSTGLVTCVTPGDATITVTTHDGGYTATCGVTDQSGWQPGVNTVAYYPLDSTNTVNDLSGNSKNMTNNGMTFGTNAGVDCGNAQNGYLERSDCIFTGTGEFTLNFWAYRNYDSNTYENAIMIGQGGGNSSLGAGVYNDKVYTFGWNGDHNSGYTMNISKWYNIVVTRTGNTGTIYVDGVSKWSGSVSFNPTSGTTIIGGGFGGPANRPGFLSQLIMEDVCWTAQEVADYFDLTKGNYGIS